MARSPFTRGERFSKAIALVAFAGMLTLARSTAVFADPDPCNTCTCTGVATCSGCQLVSAPGIMASIYVVVPGYPTYGLCEKGGTETDICPWKYLLCWSCGAKAMNNFYQVADPCNTFAGVYTGTLELYVWGCDGTGGP